MYTQNKIKMNVSNYLSSKYKAKTAASYFWEWTQFEAFLLNMNMLVSLVNHQIILLFVNHLQEKKLSNRSINRSLMVIDLVFEGLKLVNPNPVRALRLRMPKEKPLSEPLPYAALLQCLSEFPMETPLERRNHLILSLMTYQGLNAAEIMSLKINDISLQKAQISIPSILRSNSRDLDLNALQIIEIQSYLSEVRPLLPSCGEALFPCMSSSQSLNNSLMNLKKQLKKRIPKLKNLAHWRSSVIVYWLENQSILDVQNKLGHRYPSSTERYKIHIIKSLQDDLNIYHPLK